MREPASIEMEEDTKGSLKTWLRVTLKTTPFTTYIEEIRAEPTLRIVRRYDMFINASRTTVHNSTHSPTKEKLIPVRCQDEWMSSRAKVCLIMGFSISQHKLHEHRQCIQIFGIRSIAETRVALRRLWLQIRGLIVVSSWQEDVSSLEAVMMQCKATLRNVNSPWKVSKQISTRVSNDAAK